jgi:hypothetical protein
MKSDGLTLLSGSPAVTNITVENGTTLPAAVVGNKGRLFYLTQTDGSYSPGLYTSDGSAWVTGDISGVVAGTGLTGGGTSGAVTLSVDTKFTPYDICSSVLGKPDAAATVFMLQSARSFTIPTNFTASQAKASTAATASSVFTIYKNGSSIGTFTFAASGSTAAFSGAGASVVAGDLITIVAPGTQDATLANIAFTLAGNLQ